jgi:photosystem II stability/assembly factor-like uncharacterized protein
MKSISTVDAQTSYAAGDTYPDFPFIMKTTDGANWSLAYGEATYSSPLYGISAVDSNTVWAVGTDGMILKTTDGTNWAHQDFPTSNNLKGVSAIDSTNAWAVGDSGVILRTTDGTSWSVQDSGVTTDLNSVSAVSTSTAWAVGAGGTIIKTVDGGATWTPQESGVTTNLNGVSAVDPNTAWAVGDGGVVLHTTDGGTVAPTVTSISPGTGVAGWTVKVTNLAGTGFQAGATVKLSMSGQGDIAATGVNVQSDKEITCDFDLTGAAAGAWDVVVTNPDAQEGRLAGGFTVNNPAPTTSGLSPSSETAGQPGLTLTVNGTGFITSSTVNWNGAARSTSYVSATKLTASIPASDIASAGTASVTVTNPAPGGGTSNAQTVTVNNPKPITTFISPKWKIAGQSAFTLTVNGRNFVAGSAVKWNGANMTTTYVSPTELTAAIPASNISTSGRPCWARWLPEFAYVTVFNPTPGGGTSNARRFWVLPSYYW